MIRINQIKVPIKDEQQCLMERIRQLTGDNSFELIRYVKKSIDARDKDRLLYIYSVDIRCKNEDKLLKKNKNISRPTKTSYNFPYKNTSDKTLAPVIIGAGPAGYFCGLYLARAGFHPIIIEQGKDVDTRTADVEQFWNGGDVNPYSNVSFGEGGAGSFSDGKLNTGIKDKSGRIQAVLADFIRCGASEEIAYLNKPHVGTDVLKDVMKNMRHEILDCGGQILFQTLFEDFEKNELVYRLRLKSLDTGEISYIDTNALILAIGHSSRDTFYMLNKNSVPMEAKAFAMGLRIEHKRQLINSSQYGEGSEASLLPAADYKMTYHSSSNRGVYSFCMCPGGYVVNASSNTEQAVVNGMSYSDRAADNSNSAIVVTVMPEDFYNEGFGSYGALAGVEYQKKYERLSFLEGKGAIPVSRYIDFKKNCASSKLGSVKPLIKGKYTLANLNNCLPAYLKNDIIEAINFYDKKLNGFADDDAVLSGIESRTSSPVRIIRNDAFMSELEGLFPCGEGAGYAGGITSAAVDGIKVAEATAAYLLDLH